MENKELSRKYVIVNCPYCHKKTKGAGLKMVRAYSQAKFAGAKPKRIARSLNCTDQYVRELIRDFPHLCEHCHGRLVPSKRDWEILRLRWTGATQEKISNTFGLSTYETRKILKRWSHNVCIADELRIWPRRDYPKWWFTTLERSEKGASARHPMAGYSYQRDGKTEDY